VFSLKAWSWSLLMRLPGEKGKEQFRPNKLGPDTHF